MGSQDADQQPFHIRSVAIIGAGPSGLCTAKSLLAQGPFNQIVIYEQQPEVGGVWLHTSPPSPGTIPVPQVDPFLPPDLPDRTRQFVFPTPMYDTLHANIQRRLMQFSDIPLPQDTLIYPSREDVQSYLVAYAGPMRDMIRFSTQVTRVQLDSRHRWVVESVSVTDGMTDKSIFDAVVVASGHYATPYMPPAPGLEAFHTAYPGVVTHSKQYRAPAQFTGKKVVVVGNAASGLDVASQISRVCASPLLLSARTPSSPEALAHAGAEEVPQIAEFLVARRGVRFADGRVETDIDAVVFATGYLLGFPFLASVLDKQDTNGRRVAGLYRHVFHIENPTLAFVGLYYKVAPFSVSESQAALVSRVWANEMALPSARVMREWEHDMARDAERRGVDLHVFPDGGDAAYIKAVHDEVVACGSTGKMPPFWDDELQWQRHICAKAKLRFEMQGRTARSLEELGFRFEPGGREKGVAVEADA